MDDFGASRHGEYELSAEGVSEGTRTPDRLDHNQELYQLSYAHQGRSNLAEAPRLSVAGRCGGRSRLSVMDRPDSTRIVLAGVVIAFVLLIAAVWASDTGLAASLALTGVIVLVGVGTIAMVIPARTPATASTTSATGCGTRFPDGSSAPGRTRTCGPLLRRQPLYPAELRGLSDRA